MDTKEIVCVNVKVFVILVHSVDGPILMRF